MTVRDHLAVIGLHFVIANGVLAMWCAVGKPLYGLAAFGVYGIALNIMYPKMVSEADQFRRKFEQDLSDARAEMRLDLNRKLEQLQPYNRTPYAGRTPEMH